MSDDSRSMGENQAIFRPFTRESLVQIESRISEDYAKKKELEKKRAEGEVSQIHSSLIKKNLQIIRRTQIV